jgi:hypothetical protein
MRKTLSVALAALTLAGGGLSAGAADARDHRHDNGRYYHHDRNDNGAAVVAGIAGLAIGAALASGNHDRYYDNRYRGGYYRQGYSDGRYYDRGDYARPGYAYGYGPPPPRRCRTFTQWDPYADGYIRRTTCW